MNPFTSRFAILPLCAFIAVLTGSAAGQDTYKEHLKSAEQGASTDTLLDVARRAQDLAERAQAQTTLAHEQNERLQKLLEQTNQELKQIRQELSRLRRDAVEQVSGNEPRQRASEGHQDSRLAQIEDQVEINTAQIKEQAQTKVESASRFRVRLFGMVLANTYLNTSDGSEDAVPGTAPPPAVQAYSSRNNFGTTFRQTRFGFAMTGPKFGTAGLSGDVDFDFFGGVTGNYSGDVLGALRMRTASARLDWPHTSLVIGQISPIISPLNPTSLASVWYPALGESGNLWQWRPQIVIERRMPVSEDAELLVQGGTMMPFGERVYNTVLQGGPGYEARFAFGQQVDADRRLEIGLGGYYHRQPFSFGRSVDSYAATGDWLIPLHRRLELSGEAFYGSSVTFGKPSGADVAHVFAFSGPFAHGSTAIRGVHSVGGWTQLRASATDTLDFNAAYGIDDPRNRDIFAGLVEPTIVLENQTVSGNFIYHLRSNFLVSLEYRRLWTTYPSGRTTNNHFNVGVGYLF